MSFPSKLALRCRRGLAPPPRVVYHAVAGARHQTEAEKLDRRLLLSFAQQIEKRLIIPGLAEDAHAAIAAVEYVTHHLARRGPRCSWHARRVANELSRVNKMDVTLSAFKHLDAAGVDPLANHASAMRRRELLRRWAWAKLGGNELGYRESQITARFILHVHATYGLDVCRASLFKWDELYREGGIAALMDGRATRGHSPRRGGAGGAIEGNS